MTGESGVIESPNFPDYYPYEFSCVWLIDVGDGKSIQAIFTHFEVYEYYDEFYDDDAHQYIYSYSCGNDYLEV